METSLKARHPRLGDPATANAVAELIDSMSADPSLDGYARKLRSAGACSTPYWDLACALNYLALVAPPERYLEIGVRRGKSMAQVAAHAPRCAIVGVDLWIQPYGGVDNPGPEYVRAQLSSLGYSGELTFLSGDSHSVVPQYLEEHPRAMFDIVTVDGDHTDEGAWDDLCNVAPRLEVGGYLLFDDLTHPAHTLGPMWQRFQAEFGNRFEFATNLVDHNGTGIARRLR